MGLQDVTRVLLRADLLDYTHETLREIGEDLAEGLVLWAGRRRGATFSVAAVIRPTQRAVQSESGLSVRVDGAAIHQVNALLYKNSLELVAQVHSHPGEAYHSELDDAIPLVTTAGGLSLVVPDFARGPADLSTYAAYRLSAAGHWEEIGRDALRDLVHVLPPKPSTP
jgi:proteasome lid subunit RPN8/RPN11